MDPFTEKLLARTEARKTALAKKREEVATRSPVVTPRRPLAESNSNILPSTPTDNNHRGTLMKAAKGTPVLITSTQFPGGTPNSVVYEKYAKQASLKQKECFIELDASKAALKRTPMKEKSDLEKRCTSQLMNNTEEDKSTVNTCDHKEIVMKASMAADTDSPSVKDRKAMYMKQVQVFSTTPSKTSFSMAAKQEKESDDFMAASISGRLFPSVKEPRGSLSGGRYFNDPRNEETSLITTEKASSSPVPSKPPRIMVGSKVNKEKPSEACNANKAVPSKPPRTNSQSDVPIPPSKPPRHHVDECQVKDNQNPQLSSADVVKKPAPTPPGNDNCNNGQKKATPEKSKTTELVQKGPKRCEDEIKSDIPKKKLALEENREVENLKITSVANNLLSPNKGLVSPQTSKLMATISEDTQTQESPKALEISSISLGDIDVNSHEITFNISMTEFDQALEDKKESMFQMTYTESIQKATEKEAKSNVLDEDYEMFIPLQASFKGVHKSGYHSSFSDQYAAMVKPKKQNTTATRNFTVHERIQMLLEEAAYQQNIVLQASQAVNTCLALHEGVSCGSLEEVEAERLLKFSTERRTTCLDEVQKLKTSDADGDVSMIDEQPEDRPCNATLAISAIKIPLDKKLLSSKNSSEPCIYSFICMIKHNPKQMYCTKAVTSDEIKNNCITFDDKFEIKNVKPSFKLDISVFMLKTLLPVANSITKHKKKNATAKKKAYDNITQVTGATQGPVFRTSGFTHVASSQINLEKVHHGTHKIHLVEENSVLAGDLLINIACNPHYLNHAKGFLTIFEDVGGLGDWLRYWCILDRNILQYWKYPDEDLVKPPLGSIDLGYCVSDSVTIVPRDICARPHTMQLVLQKPLTSTDRETLIAVNAGGNMLIKYMLSADTKADKTIWMDTLGESLKDWRAWHQRSKYQNRQPRADSDVIMC